MPDPEHEVRRSLAEAVLAAGEGDDQAEYQRLELLPEGQSLPREPGKQNRLMLERPLQVHQAFPERPELGSFPVDVLDYNNSGKSVLASLSPDLGIGEGEQGMLRLNDGSAKAEGHSVVPFLVEWLEPGALITVAGLGFEQPLELNNP